MEVAKRISRWVFMTVLGLFASISPASCAPKSANSSVDAAPRFQDLPRNSGHPGVVVVTPFSPTTHALWKSMRDEVSEELDVMTVEMTETVNASKLKRELERLNPACVVLVGNRATRVFRQLQRTGAKTPPAVVLMSSFAEELVDGLHSSTGIAYEVPGVTSFVRLRALYAQKVKRVGVLHRPALKEFVKRQSQLAQIEQFELVSLEIDDEASIRELRLGLRRLLAREKVDALWVLNDNALLTTEAIRDGWLKETQRLNVPVVVGVDALVNASVGFGSVAVVPDHEALGVQAANLLFELSDNNWQAQDRPVDLPLSVRTVVDMGQAQAFHLNADSEILIDKAVY